MAETILKGKDFILRHVRMSDLESYHKNLNDRTIAKMMMSLPYPCSLNCAKKEILSNLKQYKERKPTKEAFIIDIDGKSIGKLSIKDISYGFLKHKAELAYWIGRKYRNKGIMTEAVKLITKYAFKKYKLKRLVVYTRSFNKASRSMLEHAGFKLEGILRKNKWKKGKYLDDCIYALVR